MPRLGDASRTKQLRSAIRNVRFWHALTLGSCRVLFLHVRSVLARKDYNRRKLSGQSDALPAYLEIDIFRAELLALLSLHHCFVRIVAVEAVRITKGFELFPSLGAELESQIAAREAQLAREISEAADSLNAAKACEERKAQQEIEIERARLEKERLHYSNAIQVLDEKGDKAGVARLQKQFGRSSKGHRRHGLPSRKYSCWIRLSDLKHRLFWRKDGQARFDPPTRSHGKNPRAWRCVSAV
jgi:hypothetical protein